MRHSTARLSQWIKYNCMYDIQTIIGDYKKFISNLLIALSEIGIEVGDYQIDHLCYRVKTVEEYHSLKESLMNFSSQYIENVHHGRPITKFILIEPLKYQKYSISVIELPAPQDNKVYNTSLEHLEIVVGDDFEMIKDKYKSFWTGGDDSGIYNQTIYIDFGEHKVKFHQHSLLEVLKLEGKEFVDINQ